MIKIIFLSTAFEGNSSIKNNQPTEEVPCVAYETVLKNYTQGVP